MGHIGKVLLFVVYTAWFGANPYQAEAETPPLNKPLRLPEDPEKCSHRGRIACETSHQECGGWCPETKQCLRAKTKNFQYLMCPLGENYYGLGYCHRLPAPQCALARHAFLTYGSAMGPGTIVSPCLGFCVPPLGDKLDWDNGVCMDVYAEVCDAPNKLITKTQDVPCNVRDTCHTCLYEGTGSSDTGVQLFPESHKCTWNMAEGKCTQPGGGNNTGTNFKTFRRDCPPPNDDNPADVLDSL